MMKGKKGQVTLFVIVAIVIVVAVIGFFIVKDSIFAVSIPVEIEPVYQYYTSCLEDSLVDATRLLGAGGGYIDDPGFEAGSEYAPFSNQLGFLGSGIPYWYYISGNGIEKNVVPTKEDMEDEVARYLEEKIGECDFADFEFQGFSIDRGEPSVEVDISDIKVDVRVRQRLDISRGEVDVSVKSHDIESNSKVGGYYGIARQIYDLEQEELFLEDYSLDVLKISAPDSTLLDTICFFSL